MKRILIGHRGVGKSSLLQRLSIYQNLYGESVPAYDLDREIEKMAGASITDIFALMGEPAFRQMESKTLALLLKQKNYIVALGAGFPLDDFFADRAADNEIEIIWVRRPSDELGRVFLDRPRLDPGLPAIQESQNRYQERNLVYARWAQWIYDLPEGQSFPSEIERNIFFGSIDGLMGGMTILPTHARNYESFKAREWRWDFDFFELREDLLSEQDLEKFFVLLEKNQVLISFRRPSSLTSPLLLKALEEGYRADWALELGSNMPEGISILSVHERTLEALPAVISRLEAASKSGQHLKLAVEIHDFSELELGLQWQAMDPAHRSFLPRSAKGRWGWARLWLKDRQLLNFIRQGPGSASDQPTLTEWMAAPTKTQAFAAVLGSPVAHSYSPMEHRDFFRERQLSFFAIEIAQEEWASAIVLLEKLGLKAAAVTSPLKKLAFQTCDLKTDMAEAFECINTIWRKNIFHREIWMGDNTDHVGFQSLLTTLNVSTAELNPVVIWGGGGTLPILKYCLPQAHAYSLRRAEPRKGEGVTSPKTLIWAGPPQGALPPKDWRPNLIIDLNYRDDSLAKEYAQQTGARYISGLPMFKAQAFAQQEIWEQELRSETSDLAEGKNGGQ